MHIQKTKTYEEKRTIRRRANERMKEVKNVVDGYCHWRGFVIEV